MLPVIKLESIACDPPVEIIRVDGGTLTLGRGQENTIVVDSEAVSRFHGSLIGTENYWVFKDLESTNGTWVNGVKLDPGQIRLVRCGDVIQLADFPMKITPVDPNAPEASPNPNAPSLVVFYNEHFEEEIPLESVDSRFAIGGPEGHFFIEGVANEQPHLEIAHSVGRLELSVGHSSVPVMVNRIVTRGVSALNDRDELNIGPYRLLVNDIRSAVPSDPSLAKPGAGNSLQPSKPVQAYEQPNLPEHLRPQPPDSSDEWESEASKRIAQSGKRFIFGNEPGREDATSTIAVTGFGGQGGRSGFEMSASQRFSQAVSDADKRRGSAISESLMIFFGVVIFCLMLAAMVYFFLTLS